MTAVRGKICSTSFVFAALLSCLLLASPVLAAQEGSAPEDTPTGWIFRWINFLIVVGAVAYFMKKFATPQLRDRARGIGRAIQEAAQLRDNCARELKATEVKLAGLPIEIERMRESARRDADAEADRLRAMVRGEIEKIERAAQAEMEAAGRAARLELKVEAVRLALTRAESLLRERVNGEAEALLIHEFVDDLAATAP